MTDAQKQALKWLNDHGGDACFDKNGIALAMGETAPHVRSTWNTLRDQGHVEFYSSSGKGRGRMRIATPTKPKGETDG
ncbi:hypothetical protein [Ruegeria sp. HKCCD6109]|uniref:hypothetical protein n=1 Tax=Ruegeria sp. HKCCD6109 TaxID=2683017 RepID=UPI0014924633|nr:hypothetical protein [Ruegeria sp. HKCCD6109]NOD65763.1 hypothetical protein [Ruegeria sp. HKCCD6109]